MKKVRNRIFAVVLSAVVAVNCAGCAAVTETVNGIGHSVEEKFGVKLPFLPHNAGAEGGEQATADGQAAGDGQVSADGQATADGQVSADGQATADGQAAADGTTAAEGAAAGVQAAGGQAVGEQSAAGATAGAETADVTEPGTEELSPGEQRRSSEGRFLNIYCWDESLQSLFIQYYPGYEDVGERTGKIGNVVVNWIFPEEGQAYMDLIAEKLLGAEYIPQDERVDLYLAPEEDLAIYVNSDYSLDVREKIGLTDEELEDQFPFSQQMASTDEGVLKAVTWQVNPGLFVYRRSFAKKVLGTDDPDAVQKRLKDWRTFARTGTAMKKEGYFMVSGYYDMFAAYRYGADKHWENHGTFQIPDAFTDWKNMMALFGRNKYHNKTIMGQDNWVADQGPKGKVFGLFRSFTDIDSKMAAYSLADSDLAPAKGNGSYGDYAVTAGPQPFCRGGVWILAAPSTDNLTLDREIMQNLTCDSELLLKIARNENIFTNTVSGMKEMASEDHSDAFLGGQNPYEVCYDVASRMNVLPAGNYDRWMADTYRDCVMKYLIGSQTEEEALEVFYQMVRDKYPELTVEY